MIEDPTFDISYWYAEIQSEMLGLTKRILHHYCMGDAIAMVATKLLMDGIISKHWLASHSQKAWSLSPLNQAVHLKKYILKDLDLKIDVPIPKIWLKDPTFDLVSWYQWYVDQCGIFQSWYHEIHSKLYVDTATSTSHANEENHQATMPVLLPDSMLDLEWNDLPELEIMSEDDSAGEEQDEPLSSNKSKEDDLLGLDPLSNDEDEEVNEQLEDLFSSLGEDKSLYIKWITKVLTQCQPFPGNRKPLDPLYEEGDQWFIVEHHSVRPEGSEKTTPNRYKFSTLNVSNYKDKH